MFNLIYGLKPNMSRNDIEKLVCGAIRDERERYKKSLTQYLYNKKRDNKFDFSQGFDKGQIIIIKYNIISLNNFLRNSRECL